MRLRYILPVFPLIALVLVATGTGLWLPGPPVQVWIPAAPQSDGILLAEYEKGPSTTAHAAVLYERSTGTVLYGKEMHTRRAPASTTKVMTALLAIELGRMDDIVTVSRKAAGVPGSSAALSGPENPPARPALRTVAELGQRRSRSHRRTHRRLREAFVAS